MSPGLRLMLGLVRLWILNALNASMLKRSFQRSDRSKTLYGENVGLEVPGTLENCHGVWVHTRGVVGAVRRSGRVRGKNLLPVFQSHSHVVVPEVGCAGSIVNRR